MIARDYTPGKQLPDNSGPSLDVSRAIGGNLQLLVGKPDNSSDTSICVPYFFIALAPIRSLSEGVPRF